MKDRPALFLFAAVSLAFVALGIALMWKLRVDPALPGDAPMAEYYLSMACRCPWPRIDSTWSIHTVAAPFRYRVLVPWLAGLLPFDTTTSLSLITYVSLAILYAMVLDLSRRFGLSAVAAVAGLGLSYVFEPHFVNYYHPFLVEGFALLIIAVMFYALAIDSFWLFAVAGLSGVFAREVIWFLLPVWCVRSVKRGLALTAIASVALLVERSVIWGPPYALPYTVDPMTMAIKHLNNVSNFVRDIRSTWGWAFAVTALGIGLLPARSFRTIGPMALGLLIAALVTSFFAQDIPRLFGVLMPIVAIATGQLVVSLIERRHYLLLASLIALIALQFCVTHKNGLPIDADGLAAVTRPIRLGTVWAILAAFALRRELFKSLTEQFSSMTERREGVTSTVPVP